VTPEIAPPVAGHDTINIRTTGHVGEQNHGSWKTCLLLAAGTLTGLVAVAALGRYVLNVPATPAGPGGSTTQDNATNDVSCFDTSGHKVSFVTVEPNVQLEMLDWGGSGDTLVVRTGLGANAHVYHQLLPRWPW
jgi:hypothetical protein